MAKPETVPVLYDVRSDQTGAVVVCGVSKELADSERARLAAEARLVHPDTGRPIGMERGEVTRYIVTTRNGLAV